MKVTTLIPIHHNDGSRVSTKEKNAFIREFWSRFGGATIEGTVSGHWIDDRDDRHYEDECWKLVVTCPAERLTEIESLILDIGRRLGQKAMYMEVQYFDGVKILRID